VRQKPVSDTAFNTDLDAAAADVTLREGQFARRLPVPIIGRTCGRIVELLAQNALDEIGV
jgi:hypothetical protein